MSATPQAQFCQQLAAEKSGVGMMEVCRRRLGEHASHIETDPQTNSVKLLALDLAAALALEQFPLGRLAELVRALADDGFAGRAARLQHFHELDKPEAKALRVRDRLEHLAQQGPDKFWHSVTRLKSGVVFTAHPTFAMSAALRRSLIQKVTTGADAPAGLPHRPDPDVNLSEEHRAVQDALACAQTGLKLVHSSILGVARTAFPERWRKMTPALISLATWVGYDLDGRSDIHWGKTLTFRLQEKATQLQRYAGWTANHPILSDLSARLALAAECSAEGAALFDGDLSDTDTVILAANRLTEPDPRRLICLNDSITAVEEAAQAHADEDAALDLLCLAAEMRSCGLGTAHIHLRVNAAQVRSAVKADLGVDDDIANFGRVALARAAELASDTEKTAVNFATVFTEKMTARRQFMLCAQIIKHIDASGPIRFLIAESERPATIMGALFLAKLYGVDHRVDISPLFETPSALERGGRLLEQLLDEPAYRDYVQRRGRLAIQIGFSDSGRFMGQVAADLAAERLQVLLARAMHARGINGVEVILFNTHGESMGRGAHPDSFRDRFYHLFSPWARQQYGEAGLHVIHETSFQGGDGYVHFGDETLSKSTLLSVVEDALWHAEDQTVDPFYAEANFTWDVYRGLKDWHERLFANPDYRLILSTLGPSLLVGTGSRKAKRQATGDTSLRSLRAIPNNAALQQLAVPANVFGGVGSNMMSETERLIDLFKTSPRADALLRLVSRARTRASLPAFRAYAHLLDASFWVAQASRTKDPAQTAACLSVAERLKYKKVGLALHGLANHLGPDLVKFDRLMKAGDIGLTKSQRHAMRLDMHCLHAVRIGLAIHIFRLIARLPGFSGRHDVTPEEVLDLVLSFRLRDALSLLEEIFPADGALAERLMAVSEPGDRDAYSEHGFPEIQSDIITPLRRAIPILEEISVALSHIYGAWG